MPWLSGPQAAPAWLYTRESDTVRLEVRDVGSAFELLSSGPGQVRHVYRCTDALALINQQMQIEQGLVAAGYSLENFVIDRRVAKDRRRWDRDKPDRRG